MEEVFTGHEVIKAFGRQVAVAAAFSGSNRRLSRASARAQYVSGVVQPLMVFVSNLNYVAVAVVGALQVTAGAMTIGGLQAFIQFSRLFSQPMGQVGGMLTLLQSCLASADRVFALLDAAEVTAGPLPGPAPGTRHAGTRHAGTRHAGTRDAGTRNVRTRDAGSQGANRLRAGRLQLPPGYTSGAGSHLHRGAGADRCGRGPHRRRQDDRGEPAHAVL
ncbi:ABC transporter transmembrane domain-containing protein [Arthrobacter sp. V4I6]|uniref:ABC transporter transmembrane domain-containing protein n=1 Tax=Arthrobacter sp. V4I6 TaxID=3042281 RepID=UPI0035947C48